METETTTVTIPSQEAAKAGRKIASREKRGRGISEEEAKANFYIALVNKLNQKADTPTPKPDESIKIDFSNYSKAYQNFAQKNVSKLEGFDTAVNVSDQYRRKLAELVDSKKNFK
jgi:hypothetical protein